MNNYYFTFGSSETFPFQYGWVKVGAKSKQEAIEEYNRNFPPLNENTVNCSFIYGEEFEKTDMFKGRFGDYCHLEL